jgi:hypothetical protein
MIRSSLFLILAGLTVAAVPSFSSAQQQGGGREQFMTRLKERLGATDDEWKVLQPKIEKVNTARRSSFGGFGGGGRRGGGNNGGNDNAEQSPVQKASADLRTALDNKDTPAEDIAKKLAALREAREKARAEVTAAQKELKEVLTQRQEAVLVTFGMLD